MAAVGPLPSFDGRHDIRVRSRTKDGHEAVASTGKDPLERTAEITAKADTGGAPDFTGPVVHGEPGGRFSPGAGLVDQAATAASSDVGALPGNAG